MLIFILVVAVVLRITHILATKQAENFVNKVMREAEERDEEEENDD